MTFPVKDEETQVYRVISEISKVTPSKNNSRHEPHFQIRSIKYSPPMATDLLPPTRLPVTPNKATAQVRRTLPEALSVSRSLNSPPRRVRRAGSPTPIPHPDPPPATRREPFESSTCPERSTRTFSATPILPSEREGHRNPFK